MWRSFSYFAALYSAKEGVFHCTLQRKVRDLYLGRSSSPISSSSSGTTCMLLILPENNIVMTLGLLDMTYQDNKEGQFS